MMVILMNNVKDETGKYPRKEPKWVEVKGLYRVNIMIDEHDGYKDVFMEIFRWSTDSVPFDPRAYVPRCIPHKEFSFVLEHLRGHFTYEEIKQIKKYLGAFRGATVCEPHLCSLPENGSVMPLGRLPASRGKGDFYLFFKHDGYPFLFDIAGYFDLRRHDPVMSKPKKSVNQQKRGQR